MEGKVKARKEWAKRSAALEFIRLLYEKGELDDSLKVKKKEAVVVDEFSEDEDDAIKKVQEETADSSVTNSHPSWTPSHAPLSTFTLWN